MPNEKPLVIEQEKVLRQLFPRLPILSSDKAGWHGIHFQYHRQPSYEVPEVCCPMHGIAIFTQAQPQIQAERILDGRFQYDPVKAGDIVVVPANVGHGACWHTEGDFILIGIDSTIFSHIVDESPYPDRMKVIPHFATQDPLVYQIGLALKAVLENEREGNRLYAETMANALAVHLLQYYSAQQLIVRDYAGGLSKNKLQRVVEYINDYLDRDLGLAELAAVVQMSSHYFSRLFKQSTGLTPHQYVIRCRVERAKQLLIKGDLTLAAVAHRVGFADQSHLNRHFKHLIGVTPKSLKK